MGKYNDDNGVTERINISSRFYLNRMNLYRHFLLLIQPKQGVNATKVLEGVENEETKY